MLNNAFHQRFRQPDFHILWLVFALLAGGAIIRLYRLPEIPFMHDEFSAIIRARFDSFHELIEHGVKIDGHPAGVQVLIWLLVQSFGVSEVILKLPFILFGVGAIFMTFLIGREWFNETAGLVAASFVAFLQFPVMYSQIARPYASGLFFVTLMVWFWSRALFRPGKRTWPWLTGFALAAAMCAYNHHFSMLFAVMAGTTGLFFTTGVNRKGYLVACLVAVVLYIPHLPVFFRQLRTGGVEGWLHKPRVDFIGDHIAYIFHFSTAVALLLILLISLALYWHEPGKPLRLKFFIVSALWFLLPYLIGFLYSRYRSAVLQHSVLIFSFPWLLFLFSGLFNTVRRDRQLLLVLLISGTLVTSLIVERRHFILFYKGAYREIVADASAAVDSLGNDRCTILLDTKKEINPYYLRMPEFKGLAFRYLEDVGQQGKLVTYLEGLNTDFLGFGCLSSTAWENYAVIAGRFPYLITHKKYNGADFYLFARQPPQHPVKEYFREYVNTFEGAVPEWGYYNDSLCSDSVVLEGKKSYAEKAGREFSPTFSLPLRSMIRSADDVIDVSVTMQTPMVFPAAWLVVSVTSGGKQIYWNAASVNSYVTPGGQGTVYQSLRCSDIDLRHRDLMFGTFIWNPVKSPYVMDHFRVRVRSGNEVMYGLYKKVAK